MYIVYLLSVDCFPIGNATNLQHASNGMDSKGLDGGSSDTKTDLIERYEIQTEPTATGGPKYLNYYGRL